MLDIINSTAFKRPLYFSLSVPEQTYDFAEPYCEGEGLVVKMHSRKIDNNNIDRCYYNLTKVYEWGGANQLTKLQMSKASHYISLFAITIDELVDANKMDSALTLLNIQKKIFADTIVDVGIFHLKILNGWYAVNKPEEGNKFANSILATLETETSIQDPYFDMDAHIMLLMEMRDIVKKNGQTELEKRYDELIEKWESNIKTKEE